MRHRGLTGPVFMPAITLILGTNVCQLLTHAGAQPLYNQPKTHVLAVNGEIYNHRALRAEYGDRYQFQTDPTAK